MPAIRTPLPLLAALATIVALACLPHPAPSRAGHGDREGFDEPAAALDYQLAQRLPPGATELPVERYAVALARQAKMHAPGAKLGPRAWRSAGPDNVGGRTRAIVFDAGDPETMYAASVSGGVWKSTDGGASWRFTGDAFANLATVSLAIDPGDSRVLYAGTGEGVYVNRPVSRSRGLRGDGIFVSRDGAATWRQLSATRGNADFDYVNALAFDGSGTLFAATRTGVFATRDGGFGWTLSFAAPNGDGCNDLAWVAATQRLLAACGSFSGGSLHALAGGAWSTLPSPVGAGRTKLAVAPSNGNVVYALTAQKDDAALLALRRSGDGGASFTTVLDRASADLPSSLLLSNPIASLDERCVGVLPPLSGQGWYDNALAVDPRNPEVVWAGGIDLFRSDNGGRNFSAASRWFANPAANEYVHADQHVIAFDPRYDGTTNERLFIGNDGGVFVTDDALGDTTDDLCGEGGTMRWRRRAGGYAVTQFYHGAASADGAVLTGGAQDNGTSLGTRGGNNWSAILGGDGGYTAIDPRTAQRIYASSQFGSFWRSDDGGATFDEIRAGLPSVSSGNYLFIAPFALDAQRPDTLWTGAGSRVYRTTDRGNGWSATGGGNVDPRGGKLSSIASAPAPAAPASVVVAGFDSGTIAVSTDGGSSWRTSQPRAGFVSSIVFVPERAGVVYATYSNFGGSHVWRSTDNGATWTARDGSDPRFAIPDVPAHTTMTDPRDASRLWLGTDIGLFTSPDDGERWYADASGLGNVLVEHLVRAGSGADAELVAFTYGRGAFRARWTELPGLAVNPGWNGLWFEPATAGQGFQVDVNAQTGQAVVGWYTHVPDGGAGTRSNHIWLLGNGPIVNGSANVPLFRAPGGRFDDGTASVAQVGALTIAFTSCTQATVGYTVTLDGVERSGEIPLSRLSPDVLCEEFRARGDGAITAANLGIQPGGFEYGHTGSWYEPATSGQGMLLEVDPPRGAIQASWYTYDYADARGDGSQTPTWYIAQGNLDGTRAALTVFRTVGGRFDDPAATMTEAVGTLTLFVRSCNRIDAEYSLTLAGQARNGSIALERLTPPDVCQIAAP